MNQTTRPYRCPRSRPDQARVFRRCGRSCAGTLGAAAERCSDRIRLAAFFKVGDVTISPFSIFIAIGLFALVFGMFHAVLQWVDSKLFPHLNFDLGLRNSIRTSPGYLGFLVAAGLALGYLGLNFEKLAIVAGALSVGIGFGLQTIVNNFVSGRILLWERASGSAIGSWSGPTRASCPASMSVRPKSRLLIAPR
jgi:small-conductance mechanosensitive channel